MTTASKLEFSRRNPVLRAVVFLLMLLPGAGVCTATVLGAFSQKPGAALAFFALGAFMVAGSVWFVFVDSRLHIDLQSGDVELVSGFGGRTRTVRPAGSFQRVKVDTGTVRANHQTYTRWRVWLEGAQERPLYVHEYAKEALARDLATQLEGSAVIGAGASGGPRT